MSRDAVPRIVVGERSALMRRVLGDPLRETGWEVLEGADGATVLELTRTERPDVVLLARELGALSGTDVLDALMADEATAGTPVLFVTGRVRSNELVQGLERGAYDYVRKPVDPAELVARIRNALRLRHLQEELQQRNVELERLARTDRLTGLSNRHEAEYVLGRLLAASERHGRPFALALADVDYFKVINDSRGHSVGDTVLRKVARRLDSGLRGEDLAARWGGEEFLLLLVDAPSAVATCERLRASIADTAVDVGTAPPVTVSASFGWAAWEPGISGEALIARADEALYQAKRNGRNRVESA